MLTGVSELLLHLAEWRTASGHELRLLGRSEFSHGAHGRFGVISITPLVRRSRWSPRCRASVRGWCDEQGYRVFVAHSPEDLVTLLDRGDLTDMHQ